MKNIKDTKMLILVKITETDKKNLQYTRKNVCKMYRYEGTILAILWTSM